MTDGKKQMAEFGANKKISLGEVFPLFFFLPPQQNKFTLAWDKLIVVILPQVRWLPDAGWRLLRSVIFIFWMVRRLCIISGNCKGEVMNDELPLVGIPPQCRQIIITMKKNPKLCNLRFWTLVTVSSVNNQSAAWRTHILFSCRHTAPHLVVGRHKHFKL